MIPVRILVIVGFLAGLQSAPLWAMPSQEERAPYTHSVHCHVPRDLIPPRIRREYNADYMTMALKVRPPLRFRVSGHVKWGRSEFRDFPSRVKLNRVNIDYGGQGSFFEKAKVTFHSEFDLESLPAFELLVSRSENSHIIWEPWQGGMSLSGPLLCNVKFLEYRNSSRLF